MSNIPEEVYLEILYRVPVKTTFVCKCVCKSWLSLISTHDFVKMHLNVSIQKNNPKLMIKYQDPLENRLLVERRGVSLYSVSYDSLSSSINDFEYEAVELHYPLGYYDYFFKTMGVCDGLVCLCFQVGSRDALFLWNPATREFKGILAAPNEASDTKEIGICGFCYDERIGDYKIVKLMQWNRSLRVDTRYAVDRIDQSQGLSLVDVYNMGSNSWKSIQSVPYSFPICGIPGVLVNGALHWLGHTEALQRSLVMVAFNIIEERFEDLQLPKQLLDKKRIFKTVGVLKGCLCVINSIGRNRFQVSKMEDYGVQESWNLCHVITNQRIANRSSLRLVWFKNGEVLFHIPGDLVFYDSENGSAREPNVRSASLILIEEEVYFESLVSLKSGRYVGEPPPEEE